MWGLLIICFHPWAHMVQVTQASPRATVWIVKLDCKMSLGVLKSFQAFHEVSSMLFHRDKDQLQLLWGFACGVQDPPAPTRASYRVLD
jgi:hypothetical protein